MRYVFRLFFVFFYKKDVGNGLQGNGKYVIIKKIINCSYTK